MEHPPTRRLAIDPITRVEGHGKITLLLDAANRVQEARLHIVEFRGFEKFIQGRPYTEVPFFVQRLCGICPVSHHLAAAKAVDQLVGVDALTPTALKLRRLLHFAQVLQSHALHFFHLASPDFLFGFGADVRQRNIAAVLARYPEIGLKGVKLRKYGQQVIEVLAGKRIHGAVTAPGGMRKALSAAERDNLLADIGNVIQWAQDAVALNAQIHRAHPEHHSFATVPSHYLSLIGTQGELELYHGGLRARTAHGDTLFEQLDDAAYATAIHEEVRPWSYMKFPYFTALGAEHGWYRVGPLARVNLCDAIPTPLAEAARREFRTLNSSGYVHHTLAYHWARMIEMLHCAEAIQLLLEDSAITATALQAPLGTPRPRGIGIIEAPRGTLIHDYQVDAQGLITKANLIVSTTNNNQAMNESLRAVADRYFDGREVTEGLLNHLEVAIRAYDPCLSCATHALGKMPLEIEVRTADGQLLSRLERHFD